MDVNQRNFEEIFLSERSHPATVPDKNNLVEVSRRIEAVLSKWTFLIDQPLPFDIITPNFVIIKVKKSLMRLFILLFLVKDFFYL